MLFSPVMRRGVRGAAVAVLLTCGAAACTGGSDASDGDGSTGSAAPETAGATSAPGASSSVSPVSLTDEEVRDVVNAMDEALQSGDVETYLQHVAPELAEQQRAWFEALHAVPMEVRQLRIDGVVSRNDPQGTVVHVGLRHQITGADPEPVLEQYRWVLGSGEGDRTVLAGVSGRNGDHYGYPQVWDTGAPVAVLEAGSALVLTTEDARASVEEVLPTLDLAAERSLRELPRLATDRDRLAVQLVNEAELAEILDDEGYYAGVASVILAPDEIPMDAPRLTGRSFRVDQRFLRDVELVRQELEDFGESPGGDTGLRYLTAYAAAWGDDPTQDVQFWMLEGFPLWFSAVEDEIYADQLRLTLADHHATVPRPSEIPASWPSEAGYDAAVLDALSLATFISRTAGQDALLDLVARLTLLDARREAEQVDEAYRGTVDMDQTTLVEAWADWTEELAQEGEPSVQEGR